MLSLVCAKPYRPIVRQARVPMGSHAVYPMGVVFVCLPTVVSQHVRHFLSVTRPQADVPLKRIVGEMGVPRGNDATSKVMNALPLTAMVVWVALVSEPPTARAIYVWMWPLRA